MADGGDITSWAAAGIAALAAGIAWWQTLQARGARRAAEEQAAEARGSRIAAEKQAEAAEEQVAIMRAERDGLDAPTFSVSAVNAHPEEANFFAIKVILAMEQGKALGSLAVKAAGERLHQNGLHYAAAVGVTSDWSDELLFEDVRQGREIIFYMSADDGYVGTSVNIDLECRERDGDRIWSSHYTRTIAEPPRKRGYRARFPPE
ncbi:hypothetical protein L3Q65_00430 (plasmid) [Amycolatopsis sp. FU40]|uniref:hypothetical protein n=1 Tax=Amycolatopsis sp. FU40 TaxID=2914159 RepID=UPI001F1F4E88|nr:hypothetical protein [Amycolatopsis sp. FU40]UKD50794.1 hypothetical protein L3Q65_00430 [Amycolatopsis sp. FU40]